MKETLKLEVNVNEFKQVLFTHQRLDAETKKLIDDDVCEKLFNYLLEITKIDDKKSNSKFLIDIITELKLSTIEDFLSEFFYDNECLDEDIKSKNLSDSEKFQIAKQCYIESYYETVILGDNVVICF